MKFNNLHPILMHHIAVYKRLRQRGSKWDWLIALLCLIAYIAGVLKAVAIYAPDRYIQVRNVNLQCIGIQKAGGSIAVIYLALYLSWCLMKNRSGTIKNMRLWRHPILGLAFAANRFGSLVPPIYTLYVTWPMPWWFTAVMIADIRAAVWVAQVAEAFIQSSARAAEWCVATVRDRFTTPAIVDS